MVLHLWGMGAWVRAMSISREMLAKFVTPGCLFIETGTRWGDTTINAMRLGAGSAFTFEIDRIFAALAEQHIDDALRGQASDVQVFNQASAEGLAFMFDLDPAEESIVFLDAHSDRHSPVLTELEVIRSLWKTKPAIILVDDVRLFRSNHWGISLEQVIEAIDKIGKYEYSFETGAEPEDILVARRK